MKTLLYPTLTVRLKAAVLDILVLMSVMMAAAYIFSYTPAVPEIYRVLVFIFIFFLYEPLFIGFSGGTLGHRVLGLRVKNINNPAENIGLALAITRFALKALLGWISFLTVTGNEKKRAIHDIAVGSLVYYKSNLALVGITR